MLDVVKLATLRAVVESGSFTAAGRRLALTQPAVSRQISLLERQLGLQLVRRTRQGTRPTEAGLVLAEHAAAVVERLALAEAEMAELAGLRTGRVRVGAFFTAFAQLSPEICALAERRHPGLTVDFELLDRRGAFAALQRGEIDLALVFEHDFEPLPAPPDIELVDLYDDPARVLLAAAHPLARRDALTLRQLARDTWIRAHEGQAARLLDHVLAGVDPPLMLAGRGDEPVEAQVYVAAGAGVMLAHELNVLIGRDAIAVRPLRDAPPRRIQAALGAGDRPASTEAILRVVRTVRPESPTAHER
jgi:DNA-binding transcriptional LysR family regulator